VSLIAPPIIGGVVGFNEFRVEFIRRRRGEEDGPAERSTTLFPNPIVGRLGPRLVGACLGGR
jgi:hypothetical protein